MMYPKFSFGCRAAFFGLVGLASWRQSAEGQSANHDISAALINVVQHDASNNVESVTVTTTLSINGLTLRNGSNRGDYNVQAEQGANENVTDGVMLACIAENGRDNGETNYPGVNFCTATIDYSRTSGSYYVSSFNSPTGTEYNINVAAAWFPYDEYLGGFARNSNAENGAENDLFDGSPGLVLGTHFIDNGGGKSTVDLTSFGVDSRTSGILLVTHGKNEDNYASSQVNSNNGTWTVYIKDNGTDAGSYEQDPVAFVFIPKTNTNVISGRFRGDGAILIYSGSSPQFTVTNTATGTWRLTIPGQSPSSGVLMISAEGGLSQNQDNIVSYQPDATGWTIQSRDLPGSPPGLQTPSGGTEPVASFVFIPAGISVTPVSPANNAQGLSRNPVLQAGVSNSSSGNLTLNFYGRVANASSSGDFDLIAFPDTQFYTDSAHGAIPAMFYSQAEWVITNRVARNIAYVAGLGDIVDHGDNNGGNPFAEWQVATNALYRLENPTRTLLSQGIPYGTAVGNHDESPNGDATGTTTYYNRYFGTNHFGGRNYYAGHYGTNNNNHFDFFTASGMNFIVLYFAYDTTANPAVLAWGDAVLTTNANRRAIIVTHNFGNTSTPVSFSAQGQAIYNMAKTHTNVFMMLAGHVTGQGSRVDTYQGHTIRTFVSDYQGWTNGGNGFLRVITFSPANNQVIFQTFSPWTGEWLTDSKSEFFFTYNMAGAATTNGSAFALLGTLSNVPPNSVASFAWTNLQNNTAYEWQVSATDEDGNSVTGPFSRFSTAPNVAPIANNQAITIYADSPTNLTLTAFDANGDPLLFHTNSLPTHGLNVNFNPTNGTITYLPTFGYRGFDKFTYSATDGIFTSANVSINMTIIAPPDANGDGLPDAWESAYGITDPNGDNDADGKKNWEEYFAQTNPTNEASALKITRAVRDQGGHITLTWPTVGGLRYRLQYCNGSTGGSLEGPFIDLPLFLTQEMDPAPYGTPSTMSFVDDFTLTGGPPAHGARYYRVRVIQ